MPESSQKKDQPKEPKVEQKIEVEDKILKDSDKIEESESPELSLSVQDDKKKEDKGSFLADFVGSKSKRTPKPT